MTISVETYNAVLQSYAKGSGDKYLQDLSLWMAARETLGVTPNASTYAILMETYCAAGEVYIVEQLLREMQKHGVATVEIRLLPLTALFGQRRCKERFHSLQASLKENGSPDDAVTLMMEKVEKLIQAGPSPGAVAKAKHAKQAKARNKSLQGSVWKCVQSPKVMFESELAVVSEVIDVEQSNWELQPFGLISGVAVGYMTIFVLLCYLAWLLANQMEDERPKRYCFVLGDKVTSWRQWVARVPRVWVQPMADLICSPTPVKILQTSSSFRLPLSLPIQAGPT